MFQTYTQFFERIQLANYQEIENGLFKIREQNHEKYVLFLSISVPSWGQWQDGSRRLSMGENTRQMQITFIPAQHERLLRRHDLEEVLLVCTPMGFDDYLDGVEINKVDKYLTIEAFEYEDGGMFDGVLPQHRGPSYRHSDFALLIRLYHPSPRIDIRTLFCLVGGPDQVVYERVLQFDILREYYRGNLVQDVMRLNLEEGDGLDIARLAFRDALFFANEGGRGPLENIDPPIQFVVNHHVCDGERIRVSNVNVQVIEHLHQDLQRRLRDILCEEHPDDEVSLEWEIGNRRRVDAAVYIGQDRLSGELHLYEIKTAETAMECVRQAIGQLFEYTYLSGLDAFEISQLVIVGYSPATPYVDDMLRALSENRPYSLSYRSIALNID